MWDKNSSISILAMNNELYFERLSLRQSKRASVSGAARSRLILTFGHNIVGGGETRRLGRRRPRPPGWRGRILAARTALHLENKKNKIFTYSRTYAYHAPEPNVCEGQWRFLREPRVTHAVDMSFNEKSRFKRPSAVSRTPGVLPNFLCCRGQIKIN